MALFVALPFLGFYLGMQYQKSITVPAVSAPNLIGGDKDVHGCLIAAGYSWCQTLNKCLRPWETPCPTAYPTRSR